MNQQQTDRIKDVIDKDASQRFHYFHGDRSCFVGGLWLAMGRTKDDFRAQHTMGDFITSTSPPGHVLVEEYGLTFPQIRHAQDINDRYHNTPHRRVALKKYIDTLVENEGE